MKIGRNPEPTRRRESVAYGNLRYFRRKAGGPARLRSASVVQKPFILDGFSIYFPIFIRVRRRLKNKTSQKHRKLVITVLGQLRNSFFGFKALRRATLCVVRKRFFGQIVSDGPKGQLKQSNMHVEIKKRWGILVCVRMMLTWDI